MSIRERLHETFVGHAGRIGQRGGSSPRGAGENRKFSKEQRVPGGRKAISYRAGRVKATAYKGSDVGVSNAGLQADAGTPLGRDKSFWKVAASRYERAAKKQGVKIGKQTAAAIKILKGK